MVAGMSARFGGAIKQFAKVGPHDSTLIEYSLQQALPAWFTKIIFIVGKMTETPFKEMFWTSYHWVPVEYAMQTFDPATRDKPRGTVDALCCARDLIHWPLIVCNGDDIYGANSFKILVDHLQNSDESVTLGYILWNVLSDKVPVNRGMYSIDNDYVQDIKEVVAIEKDKLADHGLQASDLCSMNIFGLSYNAFQALDARLSQFKTDHAGDRKLECYLAIEISNAIKENKIKMKVFSTPDTRFGVTSPEDVEIVKKQIEESLYS